MTDYKALVERVRNEPFADSLHFELADAVEALMAVNDRLGVMWEYVNRVPFPKAEKILAILEVTD
jgi:hypothetical protein